MSEVSSSEKEPLKKGLTLPGTEEPTKERAPDSDVLRVIALASASSTRALKLPNGITVALPKIGGPDYLQIERDGRTFIVGKTGKTSEIKKYHLPNARRRTIFMDDYVRVSDEVAAEIKSLLRSLKTPNPNATN